MEIVLLTIVQLSMKQYYVTVLVFFFIPIDVSYIQRNYCAISSKPALLNS